MGEKKLKDVEWSTNCARERWGAEDSRYEPVCVSKLNAMYIVFNWVSIFRFSIELRHDNDDGEWWRCKRQPTTVMAAAAVVVLASIYGRRKTDGKKCHLLLHVFLFPNHVKFAYLLVVKRKSSQSITLMLASSVCTLSQSRSREKEEEISSTNKNNNDEQIIIHKVSMQKKNTVGSGIFFIFYVHFSFLYLSYSTTTCFPFLVHLYPFEWIISFVCSHSLPLSLSLCFWCTHANLVC